MSREAFTLPDVGEGVAEGELVAWLVEPGDRVTEDQPVAEVETDKALVEVPSPFDGTVAELRAEEGEVVPVGEVIIVFEVDDEEAASADADDTADSAPPDTAASASEDTAVSASEDTAASASDDDRDGGHPPAPPRVRRLARERGVDLDALDGSGPGGRITEDDVLAAAEDGGPDTDETGEPAADSADADTPTPRETPSGDRPSATRRREESETATTERSDRPTAADRDRTLAAPATRKVAADLGVDLDAVPTDERRDGEAYVTAEQVRSYAERRERAEAERPEERSTGAADDVAAAAADAVAAALGEDGTEPTDEAPPPEPDTGASAEPTPEPDTGTNAEPTPEPERRKTDGTAAGETAAETAPGRLPVPPGEPGDRVPYRGVRRAIGEQMETARDRVPHATHHDDVDADRLVALREELNEATDVHLTYLPFVLKAVVSGLQAYPYVNAELDEEGGDIHLHDEYNVGVATATEAGLLVPVVEDVDRKGVRELAREVRESAERARDRSITHEEMQGGTVTVTNVGAIGGEYATPIVNPPEVAILALGAIRERPRVVDGDVVARATLPLSLSIDHRVVDGAVAAQFTNHVIEALESPAGLLL